MFHRMHVYEYMCTRETLPKLIRDFWGIHNSDNA